MEKDLVLDSLFACDLIRTPTTPVTRIQSISSTLFQLDSSLNSGGGLHTSIL